MLSNNKQGFLESSLLEEYLLGLTNAEETQHVERMLSEHAEVREAYTKLQDSLEMMADDLAMPAPEGLKQRILDQLQKEIKPAEPVAIRRAISWVSIAASILAIVMAGVALLQFNKANDLENQVASLTTQVEDLQSNVQGQQVQFASLQTQMDVINHPETQKHVLRGVNQAPGFETVAYWNNHTRQSYVHVRNLPELPNNQCYQMWADVDGEMLNLGIIPASGEEVLFAMTFLENAESLNVTIEPEGGSDHPTVARLVANVYI